MGTIIKWTMAVLLLILSVVTVIFLPEYITRKNDSGYMDRYHLYPQESSVTVNMDLSLDEKLELLTATEGTSGQGRISVIELDHVKDLEANDEKLLPELKKQLEIMEKAELLPVNSEDMDLNTFFQDAYLYAYTLKSKPGKIFYVWDIRFYSNTGEENYSFLVDAVTYQIYEAYVRSGQAVKYMQELMEQSEEEDYKLMTEWALKYEEYLSSQNPSEAGTGDDETENRLEYFDMDGTVDGVWMNSILSGELADYEIECSYEEYGSYFYFHILSHYERVEMELDSESASASNTDK